LPQFSQHRCPVRLLVPEVHVKIEKQLMSKELQQIREQRKRRVFPWEVKPWACPDSRQERKAKEIREKRKFYETSVLPEADEAAATIAAPTAGPTPCHPPPPRTALAAARVGGRRQPLPQPSPASPTRRWLSASLGPTRWESHRRGLGSTCRAGGILAARRKPGCRDARMSRRSAAPGNPWRRPLLEQLCSLGPEPGVAAGPWGWWLRLRPDKLSAW